jgi:hypothetical protein
MFPQLPEEMERKIWESFWSMYILKEIKIHKPIWINPSDKLLFNSSDIGAFQHGYSDLDRSLFYKRLNWNRMRYIVYETCFENICYNCLYDGFPCMNATFYGIFHPRLLNWWDMSHYRNVTHGANELAEIDPDAEFI